MERFDNLMNFISEAGELKDIERAGWVRQGVERPESVSDHSFRTTLLALVVSQDLEIDRLKVVSMALVHDLAESKVGDITPHDDVTPERKRELELDAMRDLTANLQSGNEILSLFEEFEEGITPEARLVRILDKLEMMMQAYEYGVKQPEIDLKNFWDYGDQLDFGDLQEAYNSLKELRNTNS